jgi:PAS domain S-box-containing protein
MTGARSRLDRRAFAKRIAFYYLIGASAWIFLSDLALSELTLDLQAFATYETVKGAMFVLLTTVLLYWVLSMQATQADPPISAVPAHAGATRSLWRTPLAAFAATGLVVLLAAILMFTLESRHHREEARDRLAAVLELKASQLELWLAGKRAVALSLRGGRGLREEAAILNQRDDPLTSASLAARLEEIRRNLGIDAVLMLGSKAQLLAAAGDSRYRLLSKRFRGQVADAQRSGVFVSGYLRRAPIVDGDFVLIDDFHPLTGAQPGEASPAVLVLRENARTRFFGMISDLPGAGQSAEVLLVRHEDGHVRYLSDLRFRKDSALRFTLPMSEVNLTAAMGLRGARLADGKDYRGVEVVAATRAIPGTDWFLIAKVDRAEILGHVHRSTWNWLLAIAGIAALSAFGVVTLWRQQRAVAALREQGLATERAAIGKHLDMLSRYANDIILLHDASGRIIEVNDRAVERYGYARERLLEMSAADLRPTEERAEVAHRLAEVMRVGSQLYEARHRSASGEVFPVEISSRRVSVDGSNFVQAIIRDISARSVAEARIKRLAEAHDALSAVNRAIVHIDDEGELYREICDVIVARAGFRVAWIGLIDREARMVIPAAQAGDAEAYVSALRIPFDDGHAEPRSLIERAIRTGEPVIVQDIANDPHEAVWHDGARRWNLGSKAIVPLRRAGTVVGTLNVYAAEPGAFDDEYMKLLLEMGADVSFALGSIARNRELRESEARFRAMMEQSVAAVYVIQDGRIVYANPRLLEIFGYGAGESFDENPLAHVAPPDRARVAGEMARRLQGVRSAAYSFSAMHRDGSLFTFGISAQLASYLGKPAIIAIGQDITEKERAEAERGDRLRRAEAHLAALTTVTGSASLIAGNVEDFTRELTEAAANAAGVERANVWLFDEAETELRCIDLYEVTPARHSAGATLAQAQFAPEFAALKSAAYIDANEPLTDARTAGYAESYLKPLRITSMLDAVVRFSGKNLGLLCLEHVDRPHRWDHDEIAFACQLADKLALAVTNRDRQRTQQKLRRSLEDSIAAIAATVEMRDPYTAGHERRVAEIAAAIATEMALPPFMVEGIHFGAMIHDLGKIQIPAEILSKPTRISPVEFALIKGHAQAGYDILKGIDFPWPVAEMARQHHERIDGSGYPQGLKGEQILLEARVLAVADVVEAMASHRPYRAGLGIDKALAEIERGRGTAYDPLVADACLRLFREKSYLLPA